MSHNVTLEFNKPISFRQELPDSKYSLNSYVPGAMQEGRRMIFRFYCKLSHTPRSGVIYQAQGWHATTIDPLVHDIPTGTWKVPVILFANPTEGSDWKTSHMKPFESEEQVEKYIEHMVSWGWEYGGMFGVKDQYKLPR